MISEERKRHERAREMGRQAYRGGRKESACPFRAGTSDTERYSWLQGFEEAKAAAKSERERFRR